MTAAVATSAGDRNPLGRWAALYAERGVPVFPLWGVRDGACRCGRADCDRPGKHPRIAKASGGRGYLDATTDAGRVAGWWRRWPDANIGAATGAAATWWVLDVDPRHGGAAVLADLEARFGELPATLTAHSGGGGLHFYFRHPGDGVRILTKSEAVGPGLDVRGDAGSIILPPSVHASGGLYRWDRTRTDNPADAPAWLLDRVRARPAPPPSPPRAAPGDCSALARAALASETARVLNSVAGSRNETLNRAAFNLGTLVGAFVLAEETAEFALLSAATGAGLGAAEARATIASGLRAGRLRPRRLRPWGERR